VAAINQPTNAPMAPGWPNLEALRQMAAQFNPVHRSVGWDSLRLLSVLALETWASSGVIVGAAI